MIHEVSTLSARGQVTIPKTVREAMGVDAGARLSFEVLDDRRVVLTPAPTTARMRREVASKTDPAMAHAQSADAEPHDPALEPFLGLLDKEIDAGRVRELPKDLEESMLRFLHHPDLAPVDLDEEIIGEVALGPIG